MAATLKQIYRKLNEMDMKLSALMVKEERPTRSELHAIRLGKREFLQGKFKELDKIGR